MRRKRKTVLIFIAIFLVTLLPVGALAAPDGQGEVEWMQASYLHGIGYKGNGVTVAIIDSGAINHELFNSSTLQEYYEIYDDGNNLSVRGTEYWYSPYISDSSGHGTAMVGAIKRMAPSITLLIYEANAVGQYQNSEAHAKAFEHLAANHESDGVDILSYSYGTLNPEGQPDGVKSSIERSINTLVNEGVAIFISVGNEETTEVSWPASLASSYEGVMSITAVYDAESATDNNKDEGEWWAKSQYETGKVELAAVGVDFYTSNFTSGSAYSSESGTSIATASAAGLTACLIEHYKSVPEDQRTTISPSFIEGQLEDNANDFQQPPEKVGSGTIRAKLSMVNWYDHSDTKTATYGTVTGGIPGDGSATFSESAYNTYTSWNTEGFYNVPPNGWSADWGWSCQSYGGQSGSWAKFEYDLWNTGDLVSDDYDTNHANKVYLEFYYKMASSGGSLKVYAYDGYNWDLVMTCTSRNYWYKATWSSTSQQYQLNTFKIKYEATATGTQFVGVDTHRVRTRYYCQKFKHSFSFTGLDYNAYDDAQLQLKLSSRSGTEDLIMKIGTQTWTLPVGSEQAVDVGDYITSVTFTIVIYASKESADYSSDSWTLSYIRIRVLTSDCDFYSP